MSLFTHLDCDGSDCNALLTRSEIGTRARTFRAIAKVLWRGGDVKLVRKRRLGMISIGRRSKFTVTFAAALLFVCGQFATANQFAYAAENNSAVEGVVQD